MLGCLKHSLVCLLHSSSIIDLFTIHIDDLILLWYPRLHLLYDYVCIQTYIHVCVHMIMIPHFLFREFLHLKLILALKSISDHREDHIMTRLILISKNQWLVILENFHLRFLMSLCVLMEGWSIK